MHICFASLDYPDETSGSGVGVYVQIMGHELIRKGHRVSVVALKKSKDNQDITDDKGVKIYWVNTGNIHWYISKLPLIGNIFALSIRELEYSKAIFQAVREIDRKDHIDIVEGIETGAYYLSRLRPEIKTVIRIHGEAYTFSKYTPPGQIPINIRMSRYLQRKSLLRSHQLTSPSSAHADEVRSELKAKEISIKIIPNPITIDYSVDARENNNSSRPLYVYVGRLQKVKGIIPLLKAIPKILYKAPGASFVFAGSIHPSIPQSEIEWLVNKLDIKEYVKFLGYVGYAQLKSLYREAAAIVLPSYYESFGYTFLEALIYGIPIVAFDIVSARKFIVNGKNGFLVPIDDIDALADACLRALNMKVNIPDKDTLARYGAERVCEEMIKIYNELLHDKNIEHSKRTVLTSTDTKSRVLNIFLSPHFDDVVFSCGGLIHEQIRQGQDALVVTIFGGIPDYPRISPFALEIHKKWEVADPVDLRRNEDIKAIETLGAQFLHIDFLDCIYRKNSDNSPFYNDYESMKGAIHPYDSNMSALIYDRVIKIVQKYNHENIQIFSPLAVGNHVDHQIVKMVGMRLLSEGFDVLFYEEVPYCLWVPDGLRDVIAKNENEWSSKVFPIDIKAKLNALKPYNSQFPGLGGSFRKASKRFKKYAALVGSGKFAERVWIFQKDSG